MTDSSDDTLIGDFHPAADRDDNAPFAPGDRLLQAVAQLKNVKTVFIKDVKLTPEQISILTKCSWIKRISLSKKSEVSALKVGDRRIKIQE